MRRLAWALTQIGGTVALTMEGLCVPDENYSRAHSCSPSSPPAILHEERNLKEGDGPRLRKVGSMYCTSRIALPYVPQPLDTAKRLNVTRPGTCSQTLLGCGTITNQPHAMHRKIFTAWSLEDLQCFFVDSPPVTAYLVQRRRLFNDQLLHRRLNGHEL